MSEPETLFDVEPPPAPPPVEREPAGRRRIRRQAALLARGRHPLAAMFGPLFLHPQAAPAEDRRADGLRCGSCALRQKNAWGYPKCVAGNGVRASHSEASDVRAWWPACTDYQPREATP